MKKISKIVSIIFILIIGVIVLTGCENKVGNLVKIAENKREITKGDLPGYTVYTHTSGVQFSYPSNWKSLGTTSKPAFANQTNGTNVNLVTETVPAILNFDSYITASIESIKKQLPIIGDISRENVKINGKDASILKYKMKQSDITVNLNQACFIDSNTAYILTVAVIDTNE